MNITRDYLETLFNKFKDLRVLIVGDVMIDAYLMGRVDRVSPEAPVPVVLLNKRVSMLGGAANVALNIKSLGAKPILCSVIGDDKRGDEFIELLEKDEIDTVGMIKSNNRITTTKYRIIGNKAQLLRVDEEIDTDLVEEEEVLLKERIKSLISTSDIKVVILQDYNKGVLTPEVISYITDMAAEKGIPVVVDPKKKNFACYKNVDLFKPNLKELREGLKLDLELKELDKIGQASAEWQEKQNIVSLMVTLSENGVFMRDKLNGHVQEIHVMAHLRNIADVSGAGDTVVSVASLCRALKVDSYVTAALSNLAGGLVCEHVGVVPVDGKQLLEEAIEVLHKLV